jgi:hypothetical protein
MRTLIALSQAARSSVLNDLHSLRTCGVTQSHKATADQRTTRATEKAEGRSIGRRLGTRRGTDHPVVAYHPAGAGINSTSGDQQSRRPEATSHFI